MNLLKTYLLIPVLLFVSLYSTMAQVGINTTSPKEMLDVEGSMRVRNALHLGGVTVNSAGTYKSSILASQGAGLSPKWIEIDPVLLANYIMTASFMKTDSIGVKYLLERNNFLPFIDKAEAPTLFRDMNPMLEDSEPVLKPANIGNYADAVGWHTIDGLTCSFAPRYDENRLSVSLQTVVQNAYDEVNDIVVAIGVFVDGKLKVTRSVTLMDSQLSFIPIELHHVIENLAPKAGAASYKVQIAAKLRWRGTTRRYERNNSFVNLTTLPDLIADLRGKGYVTTVGTAIFHDPKYPIIDSETGVPYTNMYYTTQGNTNSFMNMSSLRIELLEKVNSFINEE